jgi:hypothetical protein
MINIVADGCKFLSDLSFDVLLCEFSFVLRAFKAGLRIYRFIDRPSSVDVLDLILTHLMNPRQKHADNYEMASDWLKSKRYLACDLSFFTLFSFLFFLLAYVQISLSAQTVPSSQPLCTVNGRKWKWDRCLRTYTAV